jgi:AraC-like DNA-binding protein
MIEFELRHTDNKTLLRTMAASMNLPYHGEDFLLIQPPAGNGIIKIIDLAAELQVLLADVTFDHHFIAKRPPADKRYYVLHFEDVHITDSATFSVDGEKLLKKQTRHAAVRLTSNLFSNTEEISAHTQVKAVKVFFSEAWLKKYLGLGENVDGLQRYLALKTACFDIEPLDAEYHRLMEKLWNVKKDDPLQNIFLQNRVTLLIERFFTRLAEKMNRYEGKPDISQAAMERLMEVEQLLVKDLGESPPTIEALSKKVNMSPTRLKKSFKEMYGSSIYAYYQARRLQKAKELLLSGRYSIKETAETVGFYNAANFATAFKKQFKRLPSELIKLQ